LQDLTRELIYINFENSINKYLPSLTLVKISQIGHISNQTKFGQNSTKFDQIQPTLKIRQKSDKIQLIRFVVDLAQIKNRKI